MTGVATVLPGFAERDVTGVATVLPGLAKSAV